MGIRKTSKRDPQRSRLHAGNNLGPGTAWLVFDADDDLHQYRCYWMNGPGGDHLVESAQAATDIDAVSWAAARTPTARIRMPDHRTYWAGTGPPQAGFAGVWSPPTDGHAEPVRV